LKKKIISHIYLFVKEILEIPRIIDKISNPSNKTPQKCLKFFDKFGEVK